MGTAAVTHAPPPRDLFDCAACNHAEYGEEKDLTGFVVTLTRYDRATGVTTREDYAYIQGAGVVQRAEADAIADSLNPRLLTPPATGVVIDRVYGDHRPV